MLTKGDDYPLHQTSEPIAFAGTDRNFYDRYFFNGYRADGSGFFAVAFGVYPHLNVADAHFSALRDGRQICLHASRELQMERMDLTVGPIAIEVQAAVLWALQKNYFDSIEVKNIVAASNSLKDFLTSRKEALLATIRTKAALDAEIETGLKAACDEWKNTFAAK